MNNNLAKLTLLSKEEIIRNNADTYIIKAYEEYYKRCLNLMFEENQTLKDGYQENRLKIIMGFPYYPRKNIYSFSKEVEHITDRERITYYCVHKLQLDGYKIKEKLIGYQCENDKEKFSLKYEPLVIYENFVLCRKQEKVYMYDKRKKIYHFLGVLNDINFYNNFIIDNKNSQVVYITEDGAIDVTPIYYEKILNAPFLKVHKIPILSYFDFKEQANSDEEIHDMVEKIIREDIKKVNEESLLQEKEQKLKETKQLQEQIKEKEMEHHEKLKKHREEYKRTIEELKNSLEVIGKYQDNPNIVIQKIKIKSEELLETKIDNDGEEYKVIRKQYKNILKFLDLSSISFDHVSLRGIDLSYTNAEINPQTVYKKDMSYSNFEGVEFSPFKIFKGVHIENSQFGNNGGYTNFDGAITNENTILSENRKK